MSFPDVRTKALAPSFVLCEQRAMAEKPGTMELARAAGISKSYASEILNDELDKAPSRSLAIHIYRKLGWRHPIIAEITEEQMSVLEQVEPWTPSTRAAA
jgi:transcriptional regulator with XRE-family HTH domain